MADKVNTKRDRLVVDRDPCIWMTAGVVPYKWCDMNYDCMNCPFDKGMGRKMARESNLEGVSGTWRDVFKKLPAEKRYCRHMLSRFVTYKICTNAFMCHKCQFDQMIEDSMHVTDPSPVRNEELVEGFRYPKFYYFHRGHGYAMVEYGGRIRVGMDDFSACLVGIADRVDVPGLGERVRAGETGWAVTREGNHADMLSPMEGVVTAVNYRAVKEPALLNQSPYEQGWLYMLEPVGLKTGLKNLLYGEEVSGWVRAEVGRLRQIMSAHLGPTASAGGMPGRDLYDALREVGWDRLTGEFLLHA